VLEYALAAGELPGTQVVGSHGRSTQREGAEEIEPGRLPEEWFQVQRNGGGGGAPDTVVVHGPDFKRVLAGGEVRVECFAPRPCVDPVLVCPDKAVLVTDL